LPKSTQPISSVTPQSRSLLEFRQQKRGTEKQLSEALQRLRQLQAEQVQLKKSGNLQQQIATQTKIDRLSQQISKLFEPATLTDSHVKEAYPEASNTVPIRWSIGIQFDSEGTKRFAELTKNAAGTGRVIGIFFKGELISTPAVGPEFATEGITGGTAVITGNFTAEQVTDLVTQLRRKPGPTKEAKRSLKLRLSEG
jgi:preprotein translocase subunit SecD